jgi:4-amino-4-deoxy-L-arabinose transferase-like glycosyltransferase
VTISRPYVRVSRFGVALASIALFGLAIRLVYTFAAPVTLISGDGGAFHIGANLLAEGKGFLDPGAYAYSRGMLRWPGAEHPPAWTVVLAIPSVFGFTTPTDHQVFASLLGTASIIVMGLAGRGLAGPRAGLAAAALGALYPGFWLYERQMLSETLAILEVALVILLALRYRAQPTWPRALAVGVVCGALALTRAEMVLFTVLLLVPLMLFAHASWRQRIGSLAVAGSAAAIVVAPWIGYNYHRFDHHLLISTQGGRTLAASNCDAAYYGPLLGYKSLTDPACIRRSQVADADASQAGGALPGSASDTLRQDKELRRLATQYIRSHRGRLPVVLAAREGRTWGIFRPFQQLRLDLIEGDIRFLWAEYFFYLAMLPAAVAGAVILYRRRAPLWPLLAPILTVAITVATTFGSTRYRAPADVSIALLAAVTIGAVLDTALTPRRRAVPRASDTEVRVPQPAEAT